MLEIKQFENLIFWELIREYFIEVTLFKSREKKLFDFGMLVLEIKQFSYIFGCLDGLDRCFQLCF